ncbi:MAG: PilZ domain-containing protein [Candidatus Aminicenantales bacterium]|jgi:Tfp pilus assembly protein PilZ
MANKRKEDRFVERNNVSIKPYLHANNGIGINAYTRDISLGGAKIFTKELFYVGSHIKVQIELTGTGELITLEGEVKWLNVKIDEDLFELGVEFRHRISNSILCLIKHIYQGDSRIPASIT